jgi:hypothetical protein
MKKKLFQIGLTCLTLLFASLLHAQENIAQTLSIDTHFKTIIGNPVWLLELRDVESGQILPYIFDIKNKNNFWMAFSKEHSYRVKASVLKFGPYKTVNNFCYLEDGILTGKSMFIRISGTLSPDLRRAKCHVTKFYQPHYPIAHTEEMLQ